MLSDVLVNVLAEAACSLQSESAPLEQHSRAGAQTSCLFRMETRWERDSSNRNASMGLCVAKAARRKCVVMQRYIYPKAPMPM